MGHLKFSVVKPGELEIPGYSGDEPKMIAIQHLADYQLPEGIVASDTLLKLHKRQQYLPHKGDIPVSRAPLHGIKA